MLRTSFFFASNSSSVIIPCSCNFFHFVNVLTLIDDEDEKYQLDIDLSLQTTSGLTHITTRETYTPTAYYYQAFDSQGVETQAYGFAEGGIVRDENNQTIHRRGVFRFTLDENDQVVPGVYYNHGSNVYATSASNKVVSKIEALDPDLAPTRLIDDSYFNVTIKYRHKKCISFTL